MSLVLWTYLKRKVSWTFSLIFFLWFSFLTFFFFNFKWQIFFLQKTLDTWMFLAALTDDLIKISSWMYQCKIMFDSDKWKSTNKKLNFHAKIIIINLSQYVTILRSIKSIQEHFGLFFDTKLNFFTHIKAINIITSLLTI